jgi:Uncharacterized alpha/beta hydrolase domain (DUF2235)
MSNKRRLVLMLDGTWNEDSEYDQDTNIVRMRDVIAQGIDDRFNAPVSIEEVNQRDSTDVELGARLYGDYEYIMFYERGVGTGPGLDRIVGGALGTGLERNIRRAYKFISRYYSAGAEIFIFGFSRRAYTARSLVGYLGSAGLLKAENCTVELEQVAWLYYRTPPNDRLPGIRKQLEQFIQAPGELRVACLGVFDTVGSLGIPSTALRRFNREKYEFHDVELSPIVKLNLHALAIDEHRRPFSASVWRQTKFRVSNSVTEQTWFPGVHADVGGGYFSSNDRIRSETRGLDDISLDWMLKRIRHHYPDFPDLDTGVAWINGPFEKLSLQHDSRSWKYKFAGPAFRSIGNRPPPVRYRESVASYDRDGSVIGESIHISALERVGCLAPYRRNSLNRRYLPRNLILLLPDLQQRYCEPPTRPYGPEAIGITCWSGENVDPTNPGDVLENVRGVLKFAIDRLRELGMDVLSPTWNARSLLEKSDE